MINDKGNKCWIIIVTWNAMPWIDKCLRDTVNYQVIVVDNNSQDETVKYIKKHFPHVELLTQGKNLGFGQANNLGIQYALKKDADYVFLLNQDAYLQDDCISKLINVHVQNPRFGIVSPVHLNGNGKRLDRNFATYINHNKNFYSDFILKKEIKEVYKVPFVNAAAWLLSRECLATVGGFDPMFFHYGEDRNYCQRVLYFNLKIGVVPGAYIFHDREDRPEKKIRRGEKEHFERMERELKVEFGNINEDFQNKLEDVTKRRGLSKLKSYLKFNLKDARYYHEEYTMLKRILPQIRRSRKINTSQQGAHLNFDDY